MRQMRAGNLLQPYGGIVDGSRERGQPSSDGAGVLARCGGTRAEPQEPLVDAPSRMRSVVIVLSIVPIHPSTGDVSRRREGPPHWRVTPPTVACRLFGARGSSSRARFPFWLDSRRSGSVIPYPSPAHTGARVTSA